MSAIAFSSAAKGGKDGAIEPAVSQPAAAPTGQITYSWAGKKMPGELWGLAQGDIDGDGKQETILLERKRLRIGRLAKDGFTQTATCQLPALSDAARVYTIDLNDDKKDEIVVSAVEDGAPASLALDFSKGKCGTLFDHSSWSFRVIDAAPAQARKILVGQSWSSQSFFFGPVLEMKFENGKLAAGQKIELPGSVGLYQFAFLPSKEGAVRVAVLKGRAPLEVYESTGRKFKRTWRSGERFGGSLNVVPASQRDVLGSKQSESVAFDSPPLVAAGGGIVAARSDMPVGSVVGLKPYIRGARIAGFAEDPVLGFVQRFETVDLPYAVTDMIWDAAGSGGNKFVVIAQAGGGMFEKGGEWLLLEFDPPPGVQ